MEDIKIKRFVAVAFVFLIIVCGVYLGGRITDFVADPVTFKNWINDRGMAGIAIFVFLNMVQVFIAVVPGGPFVVTAGYVFGPVYGMLICVVSCSAASVVVMLLVRRFGIKLAELFVSKDYLDFLSGYNNDPDASKRIDRLMMIIFVIPGTPKDPLTYMAGLTSIPVPVWAAVNLVGRLPGAFISAFTGNALGAGRYSAVMAAAGGLVIFYIVGRVFAGYIRGRER